MIKRIIYLIITVSFTFLNVTACSQEAQDTGVTLDEKIGHMLMVGFKGFAVEDTSHIKRDLQDYHAGGVILFDYDVPTGSPDRNIDHFDQVKKLNTQLQKLSKSDLLIAVDQEGGRVARLKPERGFPNHRSAEYLGNLDHEDTTRVYASNQAGLLQELGFNINFAPVVDLNTNPENPVIGRLERSFGADPGLVTKHAKIVLDEYNKHNVAGVLKHFPGHGSAWNDSHVGMADITDTWQEIELEPYRNLIQSDLHFAVMTAHVFNEKLDSEFPATLSKPIQTDILRNSLNFEGVLFSDDMQMEAIRSFYGLETAIKLSIHAGVDILVFANNSVYDPDIIPKSVEIIKELLVNGEISEEQIDQSYERINDLKKQLAGQ